MEILKVLLYVVEVVVCLMLAGVVLLQKPKEGGLGGALGGGALEASLGADAGNILVRATTILGAIFLVTTLVLARLTSSSVSVGAGSTQSLPVDQPAEQSAPAEEAPQS